MRILILGFCSSYLDQSVKIPNIYVIFLQSTEKIFTNSKIVRIISPVGFGVF